MDLRRVVFQVGVTYDTPLDKVQSIPGVLRAVVESVQRTRFDRAHFFSFADSSLTMEVVYYVLSNDYNVYMDIQQEINLGIKREFEARGIEFAFPTRTLHLAGTSGVNPRLQ
jgi:small-conductance mechanosensitive channel